MRVLAALSGGVDSAVAAARAVDAGHDVVGVHMALSRTRDQFRTGSRGCCSIEDAGDARRAADVLGIPYYVWDLSERFEETVVADFVAEYEAGRTPNPCVRCNEHIKFATLLDKAVALGFDAVCTGHYARIETRADGTRELHRAAGPGQGPVVRARRDGSRAPGAVDVPARRRRLQGGDPRRGRRPRAVRVRQAGLLRHLLRRRRRHPGLPALAARVAARARSSTAPARCSGSTTARTRSPSGSARVCRSAGRPPTASRGTCSSVEPVNNRVVVGSADELAVQAVEADRAVWFADADGTFACSLQVRAHGDAVPARATVRDGTRRDRARRRRVPCAVSPRGSRPCSTTAPACSARRP